MDHRGMCQQEKDAVERVKQWLGPRPITPELRDAIVAMGGKIPPGTKKGVMMRTTAFDLFNALVESGWKWCAEESAWKRGDYRITSESIDALLEMHRWFLPSLVRAVREGMTEMRCEVEGFSAEFFVVYEDPIRYRGGVRVRFPAPP
jgi:hypothetical protein